MTLSTRDQFLRVAESSFADRGFYGTSIAQIAKELDLSKQALLHHFGNKEKLYGEVLKRISERVISRTEAIVAAHDQPADQLEELVVAQFEEQLSNSDAARLLMRELLDNEQRADKAGNWYLKPYLEKLVAVAQACKPELKRWQAVAMIYQFLGAAHYFAVSQPTLDQIFDGATMSATKKGYADQLRQLVRARIESSLV